MAESETTILIIEEDPIHRQLIKKELSTLDNSYFIEFINTIEVCFAGLEKSLQYDLIVLDYELTETNTLEALKKIKKEYEFYKPVIVLLNQKHEKLIRDLITEGASECIIKDEDYPSHLIRAIKHSLKQHPEPKEKIILQYRPQEELVRFIIDEREVTGKKDETVLEVAKRYGISIPTLCYHEAVSPLAVCRLCMVEVARGKRISLVPSCVFPVQEGIVVKTVTPKIMKYRKMILELLLARCPDSEIIKEMAKEMGLIKTRFSLRSEPDNCILCGLCIGVCDGVIGAHALGFSSRGIHRKVSTPFLELSDKCTGCGECAKICPTQAITLNFIDQKIMKKRRARVAIKCDGCLGFSVRACVNNCPTGALEVMTIEEFLAKNKKSINIELRELLKYSLADKPLKEKDV